MKIEFTMSFQSLDRMTDKDLVPILFERGMPLVFLRGKEPIVAQWGSFAWYDDLAQRVRKFVWEGSENRPPLEEKKKGSPKKELFNYDEEPTRSIDLTGED